MQTELKKLWYTDDKGNRIRIAVIIFSLMDSYLNGKKAIGMRFYRDITTKIQGLEV